jgi:SPW repeat
LRFIPARTHGVLDHVVGALMIAAPYILGLADGTTAQWVLQILGLVAIGGSLMTDHELGAMRVIPMPVHLGIDIASGALLALSPWLFGFADRVFWPHLIVGLWEIGAGLMTRTMPEDAAGVAAGGYLVTQAQRHLAERSA